MESDRAALAGMNPASRPTGATSQTHAPPPPNPHVGHDAAELRFQLGVQKVRALYFGLATVVAFTVRVTGLLPVDLLFFPASTLAILTAAANPLVTLADNMDQGADKAAELASR